MVSRALPKQTARNFHSLVPAAPRAAYTTPAGIGMGRKVTKMAKVSNRRAPFQIFSQRRWVRSDLLADHTSMMLRPQSLPAHQ